MRKLAAVVLALFTMSGCYHTRNRIEISKEQKAVLLDTRTEKSVRIASGNKVILVAAIKDDNILIQSQQQRMCADEKTENFKNIEAIKRTLPGSFVGFVAGSLVAVGAGAGLIAYGASQNRDEVPDDPQTFMIYEYEPASDAGTTFLYTGIAGVTVGTILLGAAFVDMYKARDEENRMPDTTKVSQENIHKCGTEIAPNVNIVLSGGSGVSLATTSSAAGSNSLVFRTDEEGKLAIPVLHPKTIELFEQNWEQAKFTCDRCEPLTVKMPPELSARIVLQHGNQEDLKAWLDKYGEQISSPRIQDAYDEVQNRHNVFLQKKDQELKEQCEGGNVDVCEEIGRLKEYYEKKCRTGDGESCFGAGLAWQKGYEGPVDERKAERYFEKSCKKKYALGCEQLGTKYLSAPMAATVWDTSLTAGRNSGQNEVYFYVHFENNTTKKIVGVTTKVEFVNAFGKTVHKNVYENEVSLEPLTRSESTSGWRYTDNPYIRREIYDRIINMAVDGTGKVLVEVQKVYLEDGTVLKKRPKKRP